MLGQLLARNCRLPRCSNLMQTEDEQKANRTEELLIMPETTSALERALLAAQCAWGTLSATTRRPTRENSGHLAPSRPCYKSYSVLPMKFRAASPELGYALGLLQDDARVVLGKCARRFTLVKYARARPVAGAQAPSQLPHNS